jgi:predicted dehydrogenase
MTDKILKIAILGGGKMAGQHAAAIATLKERSTGSGGRSGGLRRADLKARFGTGVTIYRDADALLKEVSPDVLHIVTPPVSHVELARLALEHGAHVYVEKPFALTEADARSRSSSWPTGTGSRPALPTRCCSRMRVASTASICT